MPRALIVIVLAALFVRLFYGLSQDHLLVYDSRGGDDWLYLQMGHNLTTGFDYSDISLPTAPLYLIFNGIWQNLLPKEQAIIAIRLIQAVMSSALCFFAYRLAVRISGSERAGLVAAGVIALSPVFILESAQIMTETLYIFLVTAGLWLYVRLVDSEHAPGYAALGMVGVLLGLATLTRAVLLLFPLGLAIHLFMIYRWQAALKRAVLLLIVYSLVVSTWTIHNLVHWNRFVIAAEGFAAFLYVGATDWEGPEQVDQNLMEDAGVDEIDPENQQELYQQAAAAVISSDPLGYVQRRVTEVAAAYLQPHGTLLFSGESLRDAAFSWLRDDRSISGLVAITRADAFWPKLALYVFHYLALIAGVVGMWLTRKRWRLTLPLIGFIMYTSLIHLVLDAIPRYIFPTEIVWWVFAAVTLISGGTQETNQKLQ